MRHIERHPYEIIEHPHRAIPTRDGTHLAARIWRPRTEQPRPAVLEYIPYRKSDHTAYRDSIAHRTFAGHGHASLRVDLRGSGDSEGILRDEYLEQELDDGEDVIAWIAAQPWCDGRVIVYGKSWGGFNGLQLAARRPPGLAGVVTVCASDDRYADDVHYMGGCLLGDNLSWASVMFAFNSCPPDPRHVGERWRAMWLERLQHSGLWLPKWLAHQRRDEYWRRGSVCERYDDIACPVLAVSGWSDGYTRAVFRLVEHLGPQCWGLVGPWSHEFPHMGTPGPTIDFLGLCLRFFARWLGGRDDDLTEEPRLRVWMQDACPPRTQYAERPGRWIAEEGWPSSHIESRAFALTGAYGLVPTRDSAVGPAEPDSSLPLQSPLSVGMFAGKWCSYSGPPDLPGDQREEDGGALVFESEPLEDDLEILGAPRLLVALRSDQPVAQIAARLSSVGPRRRATRISYGLLNLCRREGPDRSDPVPVGETVVVALSLNEIGQRFPAGHRIRLSLSTSYFPLAWPPPHPVHLTILPRRSQLVLPVREPRREDAQLSSLGEGRGHPPIETRQIEPAELSWRVHRDLGTRWSTLEVIKNEGAVEIVPDGITYVRTDRETYAFEDDDFASPRGEVQTHWELRRDDWHVVSETWTRLTADDERFRVEAKLQAREGDEIVFERDWDECIPRDGI